MLETGVCNPQSFSLSGTATSNFEDTFNDWLVNGKIHRLWARDASLWGMGNEAQWLGWLDIVDEQISNLGHLRDLAEDVGKAGFRDAIVLGMGGSSLCSVVFSLTFNSQSGFPRLHVLDSTDPAQLRTLERKIDYSATLFILASKSGSTLELDTLQRYFFDRILETVGAEQAPSHFIAITDPDSKLEHVALDQGFRHIFHGVRSIGGRYSALSNFGMVPATIMGVDVLRFLQNSNQMVLACSPRFSDSSNPGVALGTLLGSLALEGRDKVTILASPGVYNLGVWLEQLLSESTGKCGKGIVPVDREPIGPPEVYGDDRVFIYMQLAGDEDNEQIQRLGELESVGQPVVRIEIRDIYHLGQEWFRWEIATAVIGSILKVNPFDQPDVEAAKIETRELIKSTEQLVSSPIERPFFCCEDFNLFADETNISALSTDSGSNQSLANYLRAHFNRIGSGDYLALLAYIEMNTSHEESLRRLRAAIRDAKRSATCVGFGPRFLHSTGQVYKGGPDTGVFLQITCDDTVDLPIPGRNYTFSTVKSAQARGDFEVFSKRGKRSLRVHLSCNTSVGLTKLEAAVAEALR